MGRQRVLFEFDAEPSGEAVEVVFHLKTQHIGVLNGRVGLDNGPEVSFRQFIYP